MVALKLATSQSKANQTHEKSAKSGLLEKIAFLPFCFCQNASKRMNEYNKKVFYSETKRNNCYRKHTPLSLRSILNPVRRATRASRSQQASPPTNELEGAGAGPGPWAGKGLCGLFYRLGNTDDVKTRPAENRLNKNELRERQRGRQRQRRERAGSGERRSVAERDFFYFFFYTPADGEK